MIHHYTRQIGERPEKMSQGTNQTEEVLTKETQSFYRECKTGLQPRVQAQGQGSRAEKSGRFAESEKSF